jgi:hypothetical protein
MDEASCELNADGGPFPAPVPLQTVWRVRHAVLTKMLLMALVQLMPKKSVYFVSTA